MQKLKWNKYSVKSKMPHNYSHCLVKLKNGKYDIAWIGEEAWENDRGTQYKDSDIKCWIFEELVPEETMRNFLDE